MFRTGAVVSLVLGLSLGPSAAADPIADATDTLRIRLVETRGADGVVTMAPGTVEAALTEKERRLFGEGYVSFTVDRPSVIYVFRDSRLSKVGEPFWLLDGDFDETAFSAEAYGKTFDVWQKTVPAGEVGLGIHAFRAVREHYFVAVAPAEDDGQVVVAGLAEERIGRVELGALTYVDRSVTLDAVSEELLGHVLVRMSSDRRPVAGVYGYYQATDFPATPEPDQILLSIAEDPATSIGVQWRTDVSVGSGAVALWRAADYDRPERPAATIVAAETTVAASARTVNQPAVHRHGALLTGLLPHTEYVYAVGDGEDRWSSVARFTTAPEGDAPASILYFGDVQEGFGRFASVFQAALRKRPDPNFIVFAGDLVSRGTDADEWDAFLHIVSPVLRSVPIVPAVGNHELKPADTADYYRQLFVLPENGPTGVEAERIYSFTWGGTDVIVLDSNLSAEAQAEWLVARLEAADDAMSLVVAHHGAYTSRPGRYYSRMTEGLAPILEGSGKVGLVLQGHDHAYLRTPPMQGGQPDPSGQGPVYVISTAGEKFYDQDSSHPYIGMGITETQMFQVIDVFRDDNQIVYRAFDLFGDERDRVVIGEDGAMLGQ